MRVRRLAGAALSVSLALVSLTASEWTVPRTPWGDPDLQGTWTAEAELSVPFERSAQYGSRQWLTDEEYGQRQRQTEAQLRGDNAEFDLEHADISSAGAVGSATSPPPHWLERRETSRRTSLVIDPPDGRVPALTAEARRRIGSTLRGSFTAGPYNGPEDMSMWDRCITRGMPGAIFPTWASTWMAALDLQRQSAGMFEYACHEGNYGLMNMLRTARSADK